MNACGLNHAEAMSHFSTCLSLEDRTKLPSVASAADFCVMEMGEVQQWRDIVQQEKQKALESVVQGPVVSVVRRVGSDMHLLSEALRPLGVIKRAGRSLLRGVLTAAGVCNDKLLGKRKVDFSGVVGLITQSMQHACMPSPPPSSDTTAREKTVQQGKKIKQRREVEDEMRKVQHTYICQCVCLPVYLPDPHHLPASRRHDVRWKWEEEMNRLSMMSRHSFCPVKSLHTSCYFALLL